VLSAHHHTCAYGREPFPACHLPCGGRGGCHETQTPRNSLTVFAVGVGRARVVRRACCGRQSHARTLLHCPLWCSAVLGLSLAATCPRELITVVCFRRVRGMSTKTLALAGGSSARSPGGATPGKGRRCLERHLPMPQDDASDLIDALLTKKARSPKSAMNSKTSVTPPQQETDSEDLCLLTTPAQSLSTARAGGAVKVTPVKRKTPGTDSRSTKKVPGTVQESAKK